jgi:hypothetical protein
MRFKLSIAGRVTITLFIVALHGLALKNLRFVYSPWARESRELGLALAQNSHPTDLVVTIGRDIGDPTPIYYSQRRGWMFPPAWPGADWWEDIVDEPSAVQLFDELRGVGAQWFGIVTTQSAKLRQNKPMLWEHIEKATELVSADRDWTIYRILPNVSKP